MMSHEQRKAVSEVFNHLLNSETRGWDGLDEYIILLEYLTNEELQREADSIYTKHENKDVRCHESHSKDKCFVPVLIEAVGAILNLYKKNGNLHEKNKYILNYYIAMYQAGMILTN